MRFFTRPAGIVIILLGIFLLSVVGEVVTQMRPRPAPPELPPHMRVRTQPDAVAAQFVDDRVCTECHADIAEKHNATNHALTLRPMRRDRLPKGFPEAVRFLDAETGIAYTLEERSGRFALTARAGGQSWSREIDFAFGSGKRAMTFVSLDGPQETRELRLSYFPKRRVGFVTPGQQGGGQDPIGRRHEGKLAQRCLACHVTVLPESRLAPEEQFMGVGCQSCHGAGQAHVAAARAGAAAGSIERMGQWGAARLNYLCGECHRSERDIDLENPAETAQTQRFQPYGLMRSACFQRSGDRLSCITCHDPHRNVETSIPVYERTCRSCHGAAKDQTVCPVNPRQGCVGCHMPSREMMPGIAMSDHWIRVFRASSSGAHPES